MIPRLVTPPASEPVSLAEAKLYLKLDGDDENDLVASLIAAARLTIEAASRKQLIAQTWRLVLKRWPSEPLRSPLSPLLAVTGAALRSSANVVTPLPNVVGQIMAGVDPPAITLGSPQPVLVPPDGQLEIDLLTGFGPAATDVPASLRQAVLMQMARWFENRGDHVTGADASLAPEIMALVNPFRGMRI
jgi:uncharacterized phiE125 gp8 family phage protein